MSRLHTLTPRRRGSQYVNLLHTTLLCRLTPSGMAAGRDLRHHSRRRHAGHLVSTSYPSGGILSPRGAWHFSDPFSGAYRRSFWDAHSAILGFILSLGLSVTITDIVKASRTISCLRRRRLTSADHGRPTATGPVFAVPTAKRLDFQPRTWLDVLDGMYPFRPAAGRVPLFPLRSLELCLDRHVVLYSLSRSQYVHRVISTCWIVPDDW